MYILNKGCVTKTKKKIEQTQKTTKKLNERTYEKIPTLLNKMRQSLMLLFDQYIQCPFGCFMVTTLFVSIINLKTSKNTLDKFFKSLHAFLNQ